MLPPAFFAGGTVHLNRFRAILLGDDSVGAGLLFTDGEADISVENQQRLKRSGKQIFVVYFVPQSAGNTAPESILNELASRVLVMPIGN